MKNTSGKKTIGLLVGGIIDSFSIDLSKDVMNAASSYDDINLVVIPGRYINRDYSKIKECQYEYQYNTLFLPKNQYLWLIPQQQNTYHGG